MCWTYMISNGLVNGANGTFQHYTKNPFQNIKFILIFLTLELDIRT